MRSRRYAFILVIVLSILPLQAADDFAGLAAEIAEANRNGSGAITLEADVRLMGALPAITGALAIDGNGHSISGDKQFRIFDVHGGSLSITNATLRDGMAPDGEGGGAIRLRNGAHVHIDSVDFSYNSAETGGAIATHGQANRLTIEKSSFIGNSSERWAGAIDVIGGLVEISRSSFWNNSSGDYGGAMVAQSGAIQVSNSTLQNNRAASYGGAIHVFGDELTLTHVTMADNVAGIGLGNAINRQAGIVRLRNSIVSSSRSGDDCANGLHQAVGNLSEDGSCGLRPLGNPRLDDLTGSPAWRPLRNGSPALDAADPAYCLEFDQLGAARPQGEGCDIGAIESPTAEPAPDPIEPPPPCPMADQIVAANTDAAVAGCRAGQGHDVITITSDITLKASLPAITSDITIEGNGFSISGNGRYRIFTVKAGKLTINRLTLTRASNSRLNSAGAAIGLEATGQLEVNHSTFSKNLASAGGAIGGRFGGVSLEVNNSRFVQNYASSSGGAISLNGGGYARIANSSFEGNTAGYQGGAIATTSGGLNISNSNFLENHARQGGVIAASGSRTDGPVPIAITHVTMRGNKASEGESIYIDKYPSVDVAIRLRNSVIAGNVDDIDDCDGRLAQNINNFIADGSCSPKLTGDPMLEKPSDASTYIAPLPGSPLIQAADPRFCTATDQLGNPRPQVGGCTIGAIEMAPSVSDLSHCSVTTTHTLNFRAGPAGDKIGSVPKQETVTVSARTPGWFKVEHEGATGWISADYVTAEGDCG